MYAPGDLLRAAAAIRPLLPELLGSEAAQVDQQLVALLDRAQLGEPVENEIAMLLATKEPTRRQMEKILSSKGEDLRYFVLPGTSAPPRPPKYVCLAEGCDYVWYRHQMGPIPACPIHRLSLVLATES
jgi:hypothetical protein